MSAIPRFRKITEDDLLPGASQPLTALGDEDNVVEFSKSSAPRAQDIILNLYLKGNSPQDIAATLGGTWTETKVLGVAESEWMHKRLDEVAISGDATNESINQLLAGHSFRAVVKLGKLIDSKHDQVSLSAIRLILEMSVIPTRKLPTVAEKPLSEDEVRYRSAAIDRQLAEAAKKVVVYQANKKA